MKDGSSGGGKDSEATRRLEDLRREFGERLFEGDLFEGLRNMLMDAHDQRDTERLKEEIRNARPEDFGRRG